MAQILNFYLTPVGCLVRNRTVASFKI